MSKDQERIIVLGPAFRGYVRSISSAFTSLGLRASAVDWPLPPSDRIDYFRHMFWRSSRQAWESDLHEACTRGLEEVALKANPDYLLVMNGARVSETAKAHCRKNGIKLALWAFDTLSRMPWINTVADDYDLLYTYEPRDVSEARELSRAAFLPLAFDPEMYQAVPESKQDYDISFVGAISWHWPRRTEVLSQMKDSLRGVRMEVWSDQVPLYSPSRLLDLLITAGKRDFRIKRGNWNHSDINRLYNRSKICLNIHHYHQSEEAINPRSFEVMGSGGFLLTDRPMKGIPDFVEGRDFAHYSSSEGLVNQVEKYLAEEDERLRIARSGHSVTVDRHTYRARASRILEDLRRL